MSKINSVQIKSSKIFTTASLIFAIFLGCLPVREVKAQLQPGIFWSKPSLSVTLQQNNPQSQSTSIFNSTKAPQNPVQNEIVSFYSTTTLSNATLVIDPQIAPFLVDTIPSAGFNLPVWDQKRVYLAFRAPAGTKEGTYEGTIQVRNGNQILPGVLKVVIKVGASTAFTLYSNPTDPLLLGAKSVDGTITEYYGTRDENGGYNSLNMIRVISADGKTTTYILDNRNRPVEIQGFNGIVFKIKYISETRVFVEIISADGTVQLSVPMDLNSVNVGQLRGAEVIQSSDSLVKKLRNKDSINQLDILPSNDLLPSLKTEECKPEISSKKTNTENQNNSTVTVEVKQCGIPSDNAIVDLEVGGNIFLPNSIRVPRTSTGVYQTTLPSSKQPIVNNIGNECQKIANAAGDVCTGVKVAGGVLAGVASLATALGTSLAGSLTAGAIAVLTIEISVAIAVALSGLAAICAVSGDAKLGNLICSASTSVVNRFITGASISLRAIVNIDGIIEPSQQLDNLNPDGPFGTLSVDLPASDIKIKSVSINPAVPDSSQGYTVNAELGCADAADQVTISYRGSDGSQGTLACAAGASSCSVSIPGGRQSSRDVIVIRNNGNIIRETVVDLTQIGYIDVFDNGSAADDAFEVSVDGRSQGSTAVGQSNEFSIRGLSPGLHTLTITCIVAPDNIGTLGVTLRNGLTFSGGGNSRSATLPQGGSVTYTIVVP